MKPLIQLTIFYIIGISIGNYLAIPLFFIYLLITFLFIASLIFFIKKLSIPTNIFLVLSIILTGILFHEIHSGFLSSKSLLKYSGNIPLTPFNKGESGNITLPPFNKGESGNIPLPPFNKGESGNIPLPPFNKEKEVILMGDICNFPEISEEKIGLIIQAEKLVVNKIVKKVNGLVLINIKSEFEPDFFYYGDRIQVTGKLKMPAGLRNSGGFDYSKYLARKKISAIVSIWDKKDIVKLGIGKFNPIVMFAYKIRDKASDTISEALPNDIEKYKSSRETLDIDKKVVRDEERKLVFPDKALVCAAFLDGLLLGKRSLLPDEVQAWFVDTGTIHILAISGLNVGLIGLIFFFIFRKIIRLPPRISSIFTFLVLIIFAIVTGAQPSVIRATIMAGAILITMIIEKDPDIYNILALSALIILLHNPLTLFDIGFQLSYVAVFGLCYWTPFIEPKLWFLPKYIAKLISASIAVQIALSPLLVFYFNKLSLVTVLANIIVVPLSGIILTLSLAMFFIGIIFMPLANLIGLINFHLVTGLLTCVSFFAHFPFAYIYLPTPSFPFIATYYLCLWALTKHKKIGTPRVVIGILVLINIFLWTYVVKINQCVLKVTFLDVGQGDAIFLEFPKGGNMLIDGGPGGEYNDAGKWVVLPFLRDKGIHELNTVIVSHYDLDHYGGLLTVLQNYKIKNLLLDNGVISDNIAEKQGLAQIIRQKAICHQVVRKGDKIIGYPEIEIYILHPSNYLDRKSSNNNSVVVKIVYQDISFLFSGDIENKAEQKLLPFKDMLASTILKIPHHGSKKCYYPPFIKLVNPKIGIITVGRNNRFNFPSKDILRNYRESGTKIYRTDKHGAVMVNTNGKRIWVTTAVSN
ncbi:MAG: DNA internalization-related competence protein ComEC/Rec2 [Nitrospirota bacterium]